MRVLGAKNIRPKWKRFDRLQKSARCWQAACASRKVHRFKTWGEFNERKMKYQIQADT